MEPIKIDLLPEQKSQFERAAKFFERVNYQIRKIVVGQDDLIEKVLLGILVGGHSLIEGPPGLAKTLLLKTVSDSISCSFKRIQFTPDLLPGDLLGNYIYHPGKYNFEFKPGAIFGNLILVDELNRASARVQSALLECMQEKQVTVDSQTFKLDEFFVVLGTQNPLDHEGTYALSEAQTDRFMFKLLAKYPEIYEEEAIVLKHCLSAIEPTKIEPVCSIYDFLQIRKLVDQVFVEPELIHKTVKLVQATRKPEEFGFKKFSEIIERGASPRASIMLIQAAKGLSLFNGRGYVLLGDLQKIVFDVLRHRVSLSYQAEAEKISSEEIIQEFSKEFLS